MACAGQDKPDVAPARVSLGRPVVREGIVYTPASVGLRGCMLYNIRVPGGQAPAVMAYQSTDGRFSYVRPEQCVKPAGVR